MYNNRVEVSKLHRNDYRFHQLIDFDTIIDAIHSLSFCGVDPLFLPNENATKYAVKTYQAYLKTVACIIYKSSTPLLFHKFA